MSDISFSIRVVNDEGDPVEGVKVTVSFDGIFHGVGEDFTDDDGWAQFESSSMHHVATGKVYLGDEEVGTVSA